MTDSVYLGVDLGGTNTKFAVVDREENLLLESSIPTRSEDGHEGVLKRIGDECLRLLDELDVRPIALGLAAPGTLDMKQGIVRYFPNFPGHWYDVPVRKILGGQVDCPVYLINDVRGATLGELDFGHGRETDTMVFLALGTGLGGGVVIDGKLRLGSIGSAGEIGHVTVIPDGRPCGCGNRGCLETLVSGPALSGEGIRLLLSGQAPNLQKIAKGDRDNVSPETMAQAAQAGDEPVRVAIERAGEHLGLAIANIVVTLHPPLFVIGGGVAQLGDLLLEPARRKLKETVCMFPPDDVRIVRSALGNKTGALGACALALREGLLDQLA